MEVQEHLVCHNARTLLATASVQHAAAAMQLHFFDRREHAQITLLAFLRMEHTLMKAHEDASATFVQLAKSSKGKACENLIKQALAKRSLLFYSELLGMPNVQALHGGSFSTTKCLVM